MGLFLGTTLDEYAAGAATVVETVIPPADAPTPPAAVKPAAVVTAVPSPAPA